MDPLAKEAADTMEKSIQSFQGSLGKLRSGRANPAILNGIMCDYYGDKMDIGSLCGISMPEPRQLLVRPYSREDIKTVAAAIGSANLGLNPQVEADAIRLIIPPLTEETRRDIAKEAKNLSEECKVAIRNIRRDYLSLIKEDDSMSDDYKDRVEDDIQKAVDDANKRVDAILTAKTTEIMSI
jgi:ribosome recycling factor